MISCSQPVDVGTLAERCDTASVVAVSWRVRPNNKTGRPTTPGNINVVKAVAAIGPEYFPEMTECVLILQAPWMMAK